MPPLVVPDTFEARLIWQIDGVDYAVNVLHYIVGSSSNSNQATADAYAAIVGAAFTSSGYRAQVGGSVTLETIGLRDLRTANQAEFVSSVALAGTSSDVALPLGVALCMTLRTALAGRSFRGRVYLPGWSEQANGSGGEVTATARTAAGAFMDDLTLPIVSSIEWALAVTSRTLLESNPVTSVLSRNDTWEYQRRRATPGI